MTDTLKLNNIVTLLKQLPQQHNIELLDGLTFLQPTNYISGNKTLPKLLEIPEEPEEQTLEFLFSITNEFLANDYNTIILFSTKPFNLRINVENQILTNLYQFSFTAADPIDVYVSNHSTEEEINISYVIANTYLLGNSYVYS